MSHLNPHTSHPAEQSPPFEELAERSRRYGTRDGVFQAIMQGGGENYLSAFALLLHASPFQIGLLSALPQLLGTGAQLLSVKLLNRLQRRKGLIVAGAFGQTLLWLPLLSLPLLLPAYGSWLLIACAAAYVAMGHVAVPPWNSLIADFVNPNQRGIYFGRRAKLMAVISFAALCASGVVLHVTETWLEAWVGFAVIFLVAAAARRLDVLPRAHG